MHSLQAACEEAEHILHLARKRPQTVPQFQEKNGKTFFSIHQKMRELYEEECAKDLHRPNKHLKSCSHLLDKLVKRYHLNTLILNLYPGNKGFSLGIRIHKGPGGSNNNNNNNQSAGTSTGENVIETMRWPYQEDELLRCVDNEELPPMVVDLLEASSPELFYSGCVIAEVRDFRQAFPHCSCDTHHVLLRPTTQSLLSDVSLLTADGEWSAEDRLALESQLVLATQGPLCLDPSPAVSIVNNRMQYQRRALNTEPLRRCARKFSQVSVNRKRKLDQFSAHHDLPLHDFIARRKARLRNSPASSSKLSKKPCENGLPTVPTPLESTMPDLTIPESGVDVMRFARAYERPRETHDCTPQLVEEYILETKRGPGRIYHIKLSILQRPSNAEYLGELYVDRDYREGERNGAACRFCLGTRAQANRYIQQFTEIFTEEGRKSVRITHVVPGQPTRVTCTAGMKESAAAAQQFQANHVPSPVMNSAPTNIVNGSVVASSSAVLPNVTSPLTSVGVSGMASQTPVNSAPVPAPVPPSQVQQKSSSSRHVTNPAISALVTSLMNSAQQYQQQVAAAAQAAAVPVSNSTSVPSPVQVTSSNSNAAILSLLNSSSPVSAGNQKILARKMTLNLLNSRLVNHGNGTGQPTQPVRVTLSSLASQLSSPPATTPPQPQQAFTISSSNATGFSNMGYSTVPISATNTVAGGSKAVTLNHSARLVNSTPSPRRLSANAPPAADATATGSNLGLSMPGLSALLAGTPAADHPIPGSANSASSLLERLTASSTSGTAPPSPYTPLPSSSPKNQFLSQSPTPSPLSSPPQQSVNLNLQGLSLASLQGAMASIPGIQNVQVSFPGLAVPISLSLNVSTSSAHTTGVIVTTLPVTTTTATCTTTTSMASSATSPLGQAGTNPAVVLTNTPPGTTLSLPVAQLMTSGVKSLNQQNIRAVGPTASVSLAQQGGGPSIQLVGTLQRPRGIVTATNKQTGLAARGIINAPRPVTLTAQQQLQLALQKQAQLCLNQQASPQSQSPAAVATKHRRRSNAADPNK